MSRRKTRKFEEVLTFSNYYPFDETKKGKWGDVVFGNSNPIVLELGCGKGDYTVALAEIFPNKNFIGVDIKSDRIWRGAKRSIEMPNVVFLRAYISDIEKYFAKNEIDEIWITFPDPYPKKSKWKKRLPSAPFLKRYKNILKPRSLIHLKTDNPPLFEFAVESAKEAGLTIEKIILDVHHQKNIEPLLEIKTTFEKRHIAIGRKIYYMRCRTKRKFLFWQKV